MFRPENIQVEPDIFDAENDMPGVGVTTNTTKRGTVMAICTDASRCGSAVYSEASIQLVGDRKDSGDPYKGLDIVILRVAPDVVVISVVQKKLLSYMEKRFKFRLIDLGKREVRKSAAQSISRKLVEPMLEISGGTVIESQTRYINPIPYQPSACLQNHLADQQPQSTSRVPDFNMPAVQQPNEGGQNEHEDMSNSAFDLYLVPNTWFSVSQGMQKLLDSEFVSNKGLVDPEEKMLFLTSRVRKSVDVCAIRAVSALELYFQHIVLSELLGQQATERESNCNGPQETTSSNNPMPIIDVRYIDPGPVLSIDRATFKSLGIMYTKNTSKNNANLNQDPEQQAMVSLYQILNQCQSLEGQRHLRTIMMWPLQDVHEIIHRQNTVEFFMKPENHLFKSQLSLQLKNVVPMSVLIAKLGQSVASYRELSKLYKALWSFMAIIDLIKSNRDQDLEILHLIVSQDSPEMRAAIDSIMSAIDFESSRQERRVQVLEGVNQDVDEKKELIRHLTKFCDGVAVQETSKYKDVLNKVCKVLYLPRIGFLCSIDYTSTSELLSIRSNKEFDVLLHTEKSVYFKTKRMEHLDTKAGDIACDLIDIQENVVMGLQNELLKHTEAILSLTEMCGELDCLITFASVSSQRGFTKPEFTTPDQEMQIEQAYHPLHYNSQALVPNDVRFYKDSVERKVKVMVITGPNSCGKTTYMKAACLVVYMAHIGCFVPAKHARMPIIDAILTRLHSPNSISTGLSSFATDIHQINYALNRATENSMIVIDEFGKGTRARDGFHLLKGLVIYFATRGAKSPYVLITTHFNRLIDHLQVQSEYISYKTFKVTRDQTKDSIVYEYKLMDGVGDMSLADKVAARAGLPAAIIERARQIRDHIINGTPIRPRPPNAA